MMSFEDFGPAYFAECDSLGVPASVADLPEAYLVYLTTERVTELREHNRMTEARTYLANVQTYSPHGVRPFDSAGGHQSIRNLGSTADDEQPHVVTQADASGIGHRTTEGS